MISFHCTAYLTTKTSDHEPDFNSPLFVEVDVGTAEANRVADNMDIRSWSRPEGKDKELSQLCLRSMNTLLRFGILLPDVLDDESDQGLYLSVHILCDNEPHGDMEAPGWDPILENKKKIKPEFRLNSTHERFLHCIREPQLRKRDRIGKCEKHTPNQKRKTKFVPEFQPFLNIKHYEPA